MILNNESVKVQPIREEDMDFIAKLWGDKNSMLSSGGVFQVDETNKKQLFEILNKVDDFNNHYIIFNDNKPVGDLSVRDYDQDKHAHLDLKILYDERTKGYAKSALKQVLHYLFHQLEGQAASFELWLLNDFVHDKLQAYGFEESSVTEDATVMTIKRDKYLELTK